MMITFTFDKNFIRQAQVPKDPKQLNKNQIVCSFSLVFCFVFFSDQRKSIKFVSKVKVIVSIFINLTLIRDYPGSSENSVNHCNPFRFSDNHMLNLTIISLELISYVYYSNNNNFSCCFIFLQLFPASRFKGGF